MKLSKSIFLKSYKHQNGVILIVALIVLLVMTGIGITIMSGATLQERMAGNNRQLSIARANAESALREAEAVIAGFNTDFYQDFSAEFGAADAADGRFISVPDNYSPNPQDRIPIVPKDAPADNLVVDANSWTANGATPALVTSVVATPSSNVTDAPRYIIEFIGSQNFTGKAPINVGSNLNTTSPPFAFRITAIGYGRDENITAILQSVYTTGQGL